MLLVNECYGPVPQGEGKSAGQDVVFLRLAGCNLACSWCDTAYTWNWKGTKFVHPDKYDKKLEAHKMSLDEVVPLVKSRSSTCKRVVISGGEPMLQQRELVKLMALLKPMGYQFEVETNGTVEPTKPFLTLVDQINCSPKLSNSGPDNPLKKRQVPVALQTLSSQEKTSFKFVVASEADMGEIMDLVTTYSMKYVFLMPEGRTKAEQLVRQRAIERLAKRHGFTFSPRLHVLAHDGARAV